MFPNWFPLTVGDQYKSWTLVRIMDTQALFQSGSQTKTLVVRGSVMFVLDWIAGVLIFLSGYEIWGQHRLMKRS